MFRLLFFLFIVVGIGLVGYGGWHLASSYAHTHAPGVERLSGEITGYHRILSQYEEAGGRLHSGLWFPQPTFRYTDAQGRSHQAVDPGFLLFEPYRRGDAVTVAYVPADAPIEAGSLTALLVEPGPLVDDFLTRYLFWLVVVLVGLPFILLPLWLGLPAPVAQSAMLDHPLLPQLPVTGRHLLRVLFALFAFAAVMASWEYVVQLLPTGRGGELVTAARDGDRAAVQQLLKEGADVDYHDRTTGETPIMTAYYYGHPELAHLLLDQPFDPRVEDKVGRTLLYYAVRAKDLPAVERLLAAGAPVTSSFQDLLATAIALREPAIALRLVDHDHPLDQVTVGGSGQGFYQGDLAILAGLPTVAAAIARRGGPFNAPRPFVDAALGRPASGNASFGKMPLSRWQALCAAAREEGLAPGARN